MLSTRTFLALQLMSLKMRRGRSFSSTRSRLIFPPVAADGGHHKPRLPTHTRPPIYRPGLVPGSRIDLARSEGEANATVLRRNLRGHLATFCPQGTGLWGLRRPTISHEHLKLRLTLFPSNCNTDVELSDLLILTMMLISTQRRRNANSFYN